MSSQVGQELEEERQRAEDAEKLAKAAIEAKVQELQKIEADRLREVLSVHDRCFTCPLCL